MAYSALEERLVCDLRLAGLGGFVREYKFHPTRKWRFDLFYPAPHNLAVECEGGAFSGGRHSTGAGMTADASKYNQAALMGIRVLRFTPPMIRSGEALETIRRALVGAVAS